MKKILSVLIIVGLLISVNIEMAFGEAQKYLDDSYLKLMTDLIHERYKDEVKDETLIDGALKGMFETMDPYTNYMTRKEAEDLFGEIGGSYKGIGAMLEQTENFVVIIKTFDDSPARNAGLLPGDKIVEVDGKSVLGKSVSDIARLIRGEDGTKVVVKVIRGSKNESEEFEITRGDIKIKPVHLECFKNVAYIALDSFNLNALEEMKSALSEVDEKGIKRLVLDLRNNPGGEVNQVVEIAKMLVPKGVITTLDYKADTEKDVAYYSELSKKKYQMIVLVNKFSASASEILAGALQDTKGAKLLGEQTYGKGRVQSVLPVLTPDAVEKFRKKTGVRSVDASLLASKYGVEPLEDDIQGWTKITVGEYTTPNGRRIDGIGLTPDIKVKNPEKFVEIDFINTLKLSEQEKFELNDESIEIMNAKKILKALEYDIEEFDTKLDENTFYEIGKFQAENGLFAHGGLDFSTQKKLNERFAKLRLSLDKQLSKALRLLKYK